MFKNTKKTIVVLFCSIIFVFAAWKTITFVIAEQGGGSPESGATSKIATISDALAALNFGSTSSGVWGDWGTDWNRIYSAATWVPSGDATPSEVKTGKYFYAGSRTRQIGQGTPIPTPTTVTPAAGDASRLNIVFKALKTISYGLETTGAWGNWGSMWNRLYSASLWTPNDANATASDVVQGKTVYSGSNRTVVTGNSLLDGYVCASSPACFGGICTTFYQDSDADALGNSGASTVRCGSTYSGYVTNTTDTNDSEYCPTDYNPAGNCNKCTTGAIAYQSSSQDLFSECSSGYNSCSGNNKIGPDGNCNGSGSCKTTGLSSACSTAGTCQTGGGCSGGNCVSVSDASSGSDPGGDCSAYYNGCSGNNRIGPDGNCNGSGSCNTGGLSSACATKSGACQTGGGCSGGSCIPVVNREQGWTGTGCNTLNYCCNFGGTCATPCAV